MKAIAVMCLMLSAAYGAAAQVDGELVAKRRVYAPIGPGLKAVRHGADGKFYVLASPNPGLIVFSPEGKKLLAMKESSGLAPAALEELRKSGEVLTQFGEDCDVDSDGNIYVADRGANAVQVFAKEGRLLKTIPVTGLPCPTCGMTTCLSHVTHGDLGAAAAAHPVGVVLALAGLVLVLPGCLLAAAAGWGPRARLFRRWRRLDLLAPGGAPNGRKQASRA